jgi:NAD(P)H dehydrogenase (quinone)
MSGLIGVTGATGIVGGRVAELLAERGLAQRLIVRDPARAPQLAGAEVRLAASYGAGDEMRRALDGVDTLFLVPGREAPDRVTHHTTAVDAAVAAAVRRIVYLSFLGASPSATFTLARQHWTTEEHIRGCGVESFTFLRMSQYMDFIPSMVSPEGVIAGPADGGRVGALLRSDVAAASVAVLAGEGRQDRDRRSDDDAHPGPSSHDGPGSHDGQTYDLTGRESFTLAEAAQEMSRLTGKSIVFRDETLEEAYASRAGYGAPDWEVEGWVTSYLAIAVGELAAVSDDVRRLTGREPTTLSEYVGAHPECLAHVVARG